MQPIRATRDAMWLFLRRRAIQILCWVGLLCLSPLVAEDHSATVLVQLGIPATGEDALKFLRQSLPSDTTEADLQVLVNQLGDRKFMQRELAERRLARFGKQAESLLRVATKSDDAEIRLRATRLLESLNRAYTREVFLAALQMIGREKPRGSAETLLALLPVTDEEWLRHAIFKTLRSSSHVEDKQLLQNALGDERPRCRAGALHALGKFIASDRLADFDKALLDEDDQVRLIAAWEITSRGQRRGLSALVGLLSSSDMRLRELSVLSLREATGKSFGFDVSQQISSELHVSVVWARWIETHPMVMLKTPLSELFQEMNLVNSKWRLVYTLPNGGPQDHYVVLRPNGKLENQNVRDTTDNDFWTCLGGSVSLKFNDNFVEYVGMLTNSATMSGTALNTKGQRWKWKATRIW